MFENWWKIALSALGSVAALFLLTKMMGKRQIAQLSFFDYINGITIGSISAELAIAGETGVFGAPLIAMVIYALAAVGISTACDKSIVLRKFFVGKPLTLFDNGAFCRGNLSKAKLDVNEFLTSCRYQGYFDLADVQTAVLETNGQISILPKSTARPASPEDLGLAPQQDLLVANVIIDGHVMEDVLRASGNNPQWLKNQLAQSGVTLDDVLLGTVDSENTFAAYKRAQPAQEQKNLFI